MRIFYLLSLTVLLTTTLQAQIKSKAYNCSAYGAKDGSIDLEIKGGNPPYFYIWSNGSTDEDQYNLASGRYTATVTDSKGLCKIEVSFDVAQPDLINSTDSKFNKSFTSRLSVFPNPTESIATINFYASSGSSLSVRVYNISGREIWNDVNIQHSGEYIHSLDFTNQPKGFYFVEVISEKETVTQRLMVQ